MVAILLLLYIKEMVKDVDDTLINGNSTLPKTTLKLLNPNPTPLILKLPLVLTQVPEVAAHVVLPSTLN